VRALALVLALAVMSSAGAQVISGGVRYDFEGLTATVQVEAPAFDLFGFRAGPVFGVTGLSRSYGLGLEASAGVRFAFASARSAWLLDAAYVLLARDGVPLRHGPRVSVTFSVARGRR
jgi:hypothetical protein